jgi:hypothetical protein
MNAREKGLSLVREVKKILALKGYKTEGPGYGVAFLGERGMRPIHRDYFGAYDLIAYRNGIFHGHQVSTLSNKASKYKTFRKLGFPGFIWAKVPRHGFRVFWIDINGVEEEIFIESL